MIRRLAGLLMVLTAMAVALHALEDVPRMVSALPSLSFGFLLIAAYLCGDLLARLKLPKITGYILAGVLFGPYLLDFVGTETVNGLKQVDDLALTFIALAAGGELRLKELRERARAILLTTLMLTLLVFLGVAALAMLSRSMLPFLSGKPFVHVIAVAAIMGTFAVARSPSSAIAIISETKARGPFTEMVLGVTVVMDVLVIVVFGVTVTVGQALLSATGGIDLRLVGMMLAEVMGSVVAGLSVGWGISLYIRRVKIELAVFLLAMAFLVTFFSRQVGHYLGLAYGFKFHLEPMLICMTAGFWIQNFTKGGAIFMEKIDRSSLAVYVIFFALTGAALKLDSLQSTWMLALLVVGARALLIWCGAWLGGRLAGDPPLFRRMSGLSFVTQAGVSLGLAGIVMRRFPEWGPTLATTIVAIITVNQVIGPIFFKLALTRVGETREGRQE